MFPVAGEIESLERARVWQPDASATQVAESPRNHRPEPRTF